MNEELKQDIVEKARAIYEAVILLDAYPTKSAIHNAELATAELSALLGRASYDEFKTETESIKAGVRQFQEDLKRVAN